MESGGTVVPRQLFSFTSGNRMSSYKLCIDDSMEWNQPEDTNHTDSLSTDRLDVPLEDTTSGTVNGRRWSADNGRSNPQKSPRMERFRRVSLGLYNQTTEVLEAGVNSFKKGISRAGQNVTERAQNKVPKMLRGKIGGQDELSKTIITNMDDADGENYEKGRTLPENESSGFG